MRPYGMIDPFKAGELVDNTSCSSYVMTCFFSHPSLVLRGTNGDSS